MVLIYQNIQGGYYVGVVVNIGVVEGCYYVDEQYLLWQFCYGCGVIGIKRFEDESERYEFEEVRQGDIISLFI